MTPISLQMSRLVWKADVDMGNMPILVTPNEYRDGIIRSMQ